MPEAGLGTKISWFLFQKGYGIAKPEFLMLVKAGDPLWFKVAEVFFKDNNLPARRLVLDQLLVSRHFNKNNPKRNEFLRVTGQYLNKGILDERRRVAKYVDDNPTLFSSTDDVIMGPLITAQRDSDIITANTAESALLKIRGEVKQTRSDFR